MQYATNKDILLFSLPNSRAPMKLQPETQARAAVSLSLPSATAAAALLFLLSLVSSFLLVASVSPRATFYSLDSASLSGRHAPKSTSFLGVA